ncbi:hypothetical protein MMC18_003811 [Xylographa bjoerkii]|nr:hypothetical protein [Xylographa bjoerkii]
MVEPSDSHSGDVNIDDLLRLGTMWLDRLSNQPTPSGYPPVVQNRSFSPAPRRSMHLAPGSLARPGYSPRSSSLSLVSRSNTSNISLPGAARISNGSTLKQQITPPEFVEDPLAILGRILGSSFHADDPIRNGAEAGTVLEKPEGFAEEIAFNSLSLQDFAHETINGETERSYGERPSPLGMQSVEEYDKEKDKLEDLHRSINACDDVLKSVETSLTSFQKDLGHVSAEIETLQNRSSALNTRLENRKIVEKLLGPAVEEISISPTIVKIISEGPIDENWLKALAELEKRSKVIEIKVKGAETIKAITDVKPLLDNLTAKAVERIRDYLAAQIKSLRSPNINAQIIQRQTLLRYKELYGFLSRHHQQLAEDLGQAYINTMRWYYLNSFTRYRHALDKILLYQVDRYDALGADQSTQRATKAPGTRLVYASHDSNNIGRRMDILKTSNATAISSYVAEEDKTIHHIETPFRSFNQALIDNVSSEYSFLAEFFSFSSFPQMSRRFTEIFEPTFNLGHLLVKDLVDTTYDCLGVLLCVRLNQHYAFELQRRKVPVADGYINGTNMLLWPRFQVAMDLHCESIRHLATTVSSRSAASKLSFTGNSSDATKQSTAPHYLTQRFGQFLYGILSISYEAGDDEPVSNSLGRLRNEYEAFLVKASKGAGTDTTKRDRFLANNYALVLTIIADTEGKLAQEQQEHFEELKSALEAQK